MQLQLLLQKKVYPKLIEGMSSRGYCSEILNFLSRKERHSKLSGD